MEMRDVRVNRLLGEIEESLRVAREMVSKNFDDFISDVRNRYTLRLALVEVVEAAVTLGLYILRRRFNVKSVEGYVQVFRKLMEHGVIPSDVGRGMEALVRLRNLIIHRYWEVDDARIYKEAKENGLSLIERFVEEVKKRAA